MTNDIEESHLRGLIRILAYRLGGEIKITEEELATEEINFSSRFDPKENLWTFRAIHPLDKSAEEVAAIRARLKDLNE